MKKLCMLLSFVLLIGCSSGEKKEEKKAAANAPSFTLAVSEYPSWSLFLVAKQIGVLEECEKKWGVKVNLKEADYDTCITLFGSGTVDASCQTNMDSLAPSLGRKSVAICPTSTSVGADACIVVGMKGVDELKGKTTYGLEKSVSQYAFERCLIKLGKNPADFPFKNMDPGSAAQAMQTGQKNIEAIQVWNPFVLQTLRTRQGAVSVFDSSAIPEEIIDMVVVGADVLDRPGGKEFACCVVDCYYQACRKLGTALGSGKVIEPLTDSESKALVAGMSEDQKKALVALGAKFSNLPAEDMAICTRQTHFYKTADLGLTLFDSKEFSTKTMPEIVDFCVSHKIVDQKPTIGFNDLNAQLNFTTEFMGRVKSGK